MKASGVFGRRLGEAAETPGHGRTLRAVDLHHHGVVATRPRRPAVGDHADGAALHLQQGIVRVLGVDGVGTPAFVDPVGMAVVISAQTPVTGAASRSIM